MKDEIFAAELTVEHVTAFIKTVALYEITYHLGSGFKFAPQKGFFNVQPYTKNVRF